ncbi:MAG: hypothetical protein ACK5JT_01270 [Hyphomicrobiaceae bacterium]
MFGNIIEAYKSVKGRRSLKIVDLGCSYGVNAALMKTDMDLDDLYRHYVNEEVGGLDCGRLIELDRRTFGAESGSSPLTVVGLDAAENALRYAEEAGIIDGQVHVNLEEEALRPEQVEVLRGADIVVSSGCIGYFGETTVAKVLDAAADRQPWMAHFVLRMFPFDPIADMLTAHGYVTAKGSHPVAQRRFASEDEQTQVLERIQKLGIDPSGLETEGSFFADLYVSRPVDECGLVPQTQLTEI